MPTTRSKSVGADDAATFEEAETSATSGSGEVRELRSQLAALTDLVTQQAAAARQQADAAYLRHHQLRRCNPRIFDGEKADHWIVEKWLMHTEKLFHDTFVEERDRVWLAPHHLEGEAYIWWLGIQDNPNTDLAIISWKRFKELLLEHYFPVSVKRKIEQDLPEICQGDRTVAEYEREFTRLLHCVPFVVRDNEDKARIFERGLRASIFRLVQSSNLQTYRDVVNRALIVESGAADLQERREGSNKEKGKRPAAEGTSQRHSRRSPRHPRNRSQSRGRGTSAQQGGSERCQTLSCVICGGRHYLQQRSQGRGRDPKGVRQPPPRFRRAGAGAGAGAGASGAGERRRLGEGAGAGAASGWPGRPEPARVARARGREGTSRRCEIPSVLLWRLVGSSGECRDKFESRWRQIDVKRTPCDARAAYREEFCKTTAFSTCCTGTSSGAVPVQPARIGLAALGLALYRYRSPCTGTRGRCEGI
uniref:Retrotransposon gag domain-containing protein n=1 Tax=Ananas comosus var. bracteatus TaxID=296719 RepID=A0A6V7P4W6_ANACO|nr:unnamed protein product [Ananas comosus var. bracteatus]